MKQIYLVFAFVVIGLQAVHADSGFPHQLSRNEKLADFRQLINQIKNGYGPKEYKKEKLGIDVNGLAEKYWPEMEETKNNGEFEPLQFQFRASKEQMLVAKEWMKKWFNNPYYMQYDAFLEIYDLIKESIEKGLHLTPKTTFHGSQKITGLGIYTKPVIILIDYFAGSGGDAFPAMMQGLGRAKLLGTTTAGLGGHVAEMPPLIYSRIETRMTQSLFFRPDGVPVENVGAIPDIPYEITVDDFVNGYKSYREFYTGEILKLINFATVAH